MNYVIIGTSAAGAQAAEELRKFDTTATITMIGKEETYPYSRCLISRYVDGRLSISDLYYKTRRFFDIFRITPIVGVEASTIDRTAHTVHCTDGRTVPYDALLVATGSRPYVPEIPGADLNGVFTFHSLSDARCIDAAAQHARTAVVIGAGFAGLEAAYALRRRGLDVTVVERCAQVLPNQFDSLAAEIIAADLADVGIRLVYNRSLAAIKGKNGCAEASILTDKSHLSSDLVVVAAGTRPNKELAAASGLATDRGIIVDEHMRTSDPAVFAAGDVIEISDVASGRRGVSATWTNAVLQGRYAAYNMAGKRRPYVEAVGIQNAVQFHRVPAISFGQTLADGDIPVECEVISIRKGKVYKKLVLRENRITGMIFVGDIAKAGFYAALIRNRVDISPFRRRLLDDDFSYAEFARTHTFGQYDPYKKTAALWDNGLWWVERSKAIAA